MNVVSTQEIKIIKMGDASYPDSLARIANPPQTLYYQGVMKTKELCVAVVGSRSCSAYGKQVALDIAGQLAEAGCTVVSGLAPGIDTFAHLAAVERQKRTIAVLGTGLDRKSFYPKENLRLAQRIVENQGCLISEYPPHNAGSKFTFPQRNRVIAGLSHAVVVIEAKEKSGALLTAQWAKKQGKMLFAVPGSIYSSTSSGCHMLIQQGAKLLQNAQDILSALNIAISQTANIPGAQITADNKEEEIVLQALQKGPLDAQTLMEKTQLSASQIATLLAILEIKGKIRNLGANIYGLKN